MLASTPVETSTPQGWTLRMASRHIVRIETAGEDQPASLRRALGKAPVENLARPWRGSVDEHDVRPVLARSAETLVACRERLYDKGDPDRDIAAVLEALPPVQLGGVEPGVVDDLDDPAGLLVAKDPDGADLRREPPGDGGHRARAHLAWGRREDEADGVGPHGHGQKGVLLACDPADLHPHGTARPKSPATAACLSRERNSASPTSTPSKPAWARATTSCGRLDARLGDLHYTWGDVTGDASGPLPVHLEAVQVALVDSHEPGPDPKCPLELVLVVDLDKSCHGEICGEPVALGQLFGLKEGDDEQDGVGAHDAGVVDVRRARP